MQQGPFALCRHRTATEPSVECERAQVVAIIAFQKIRSQFYNWSDNWKRAYVSSRGNGGCSSRSRNRSRISSRISIRGLSWAPPAVAAPAAPFTVRRATPFVPSMASPVTLALQSAWQRFFRQFTTNVAIAATTAAPELSPYTLVLVWTIVAATAATSAVAFAFATFNATTVSNLPSLSLGMREGYLLTPPPENKRSQKKWKTNTTKEQVIHLEMNKKIFFSCDELPCARIKNKDSSHPTDKTPTVAREFGGKQLLAHQWDAARERLFGPSSKEAGTRTTQVRHTVKAQVTPKRNVVFDAKKYKCAIIQ